ncbi:ABC transporter substrate-binding protein [Amycolatopsis sp. NPDC059090]|uniref:ABC transporter substrate-binding protein n=1 Tax=unclassified Amycolatopsis TaxID=2618356 RepID=UPI00366EB8C5
MNRRGVALLVTGAVAVCAALTGCGASSSAGGDAAGPAASSSEVAIPAVTKDAALAAKLPAEIRSAGALRVAMDETYPPFESVQAGNVVGLDPDLANAIGGVLGVRVEFVNTSFDAIIPSLTSNKVDLAMSSIGDTKERERTIDLATYYWNGTLVLVKSGNPAQLKADQVCGARVGVIRGSLQQTSFLPSQAAKCAAAGKQAAKVEVYQNGPQAQLALQSGRIDGVMEDAPPLLEVAARQKDVFETAGPFFRNPNPGGVAFPKGSKLVEPVHEAIGVLLKNGTYQAILKKWNLEKIAIDKSEINGAQS